MTRKIKRLTSSQKIRGDLNELYIKWRRRLGDKGLRLFVKKMGWDPKFFKIKPTDFETCWYKKFGKSPEVGAAKGLEQVATKHVAPRKPLRTETMQIHSHPLGHPLPTVRDLKSFLGLALKSKIRCAVIAVTSQGKLVGYTFMTIRDVRKTKKVKGFKKDEKILPASEVKKLGVNIRFVPIKGHKFNPKTNRFSKI